MPDPQPELDIATVMRSAVDEALARARADRARGEAARARATLERVTIEGAPTQVAAARLELALVELDAGDRGFAEELVREADKLLPGTEDRDFMMRLASCWRALGEPALAARAYRRTLELLAPPEPPLDAQLADWDPPLPSVDRHLIALSCYRLAETILDTESHDTVAAKAYLDRAVGLGDPNVAPFACLLLVDRLADHVPPQQREELLRTAASYDHPEASPEAGFRLGVWLIERGRLQAAREPLEEVRDQSGHPRWSPAAGEQLEALDERLARTPSAPPAAPPPAQVRRGPKRVLIVGAGTGGQYLWANLQKLWSDRYEIIGFVDDNRYPDGIPGVPKDKRVLGTVKDLDWILAEESPHFVWLAMPTATPRRKRQVALMCASHAVALKILPTMHELAVQCNLILQLREPRIDDLVGDREVRVDHHAGAWLRARRVMIVGAGTVGRQLARKAADSDADGIVVLDRDDDKLLELARELDTARGFRRIHVRSGSAANSKLLLETASRHKCEVVLYAAAEGWAGAGVDPERQQRLLRGVAEFVDGLRDTAPSVGRLVWVSDANVAVPNTPVRALGAIAEAIAVGGARSSEGPTRCAIRIPTVYTASSSIISRMEREIALGLPLRVPPPPARQRFIHAYEAAELILQAAEIARQGELFAVERGEDVPLTVLAERMLQLHGFADQQETMIQEAPELAIDEAPRSAGLATDVPDLVSLGRLDGVGQLDEAVETLDTRDSSDVLRLAGRIAPLDPAPDAWGGETRERAGRST